MSNLRQWGVAFNLYTGKNDGTFMKGWNGQKNKEDTLPTDQWYIALKPYYKDTAMCLCPAANKPATEANGSASAIWPTKKNQAWGTFADPPGWPVEAGDCGSYGINAWVYNLPADTYIYKEYNHWRWRNINRIKQPCDVPLLSDALWIDAWCDVSDRRYQSEEMLYISVQQDEAGIPRVCTVRHSGGINMLFADGRVVKSGLRALWSYRWHQQYDLSEVPHRYPAWMP